MCVIIKNGIYQRTSQALLMLVAQDRIYRLYLTGYFSAHWPLGGLVNWSYQRYVDMWETMTFAAHLQFIPPFTGKMWAKLFMQVPMAAPLALCSDQFAREQAPSLVLLIKRNQFKFKCKLKLKLKFKFKLNTCHSIWFVPLQLYPSIHKRRHYAREHRALLWQGISDINGSSFSACRNFTSFLPPQDS